jgi:hypothetical protein
MSINKENFAPDPAIFSTDIDRRYKLGRVIE